MNMYAPNIGTPMFKVKRILRRNSSNIIIRGNSNTPLLLLDMSPGLKINEVVADINNSTYQMNLEDK